MALPITLLMLNLLNFVMAMVVVSFAFSSRKLTSVRWMLLLVLSFCVVSFCTLGVYVSRDLDVQILFSRMRFLSLGLLPPSWLLFVLSVYGKWKWVKNPWFVGAILFPGVVTTVLTLNPLWHDLIVKDFAPLTVNGFSVLQYTGGAWFPFHYTWAMFLVLLSVAFGVYFFVKEKGVRRHQIVLLIFASTLAAGVDIYCVLTNSPMRWLLLASGTFLFSQLGILIAALKLRLLNIIPLAMSRVFNEFPDPVFVIDGDKIIRAVNRVALQFFTLKDPLGHVFSEILPDVEVKDGEIEITGKDGETRFFDVSIESLAVAAGDVAGQVIFLRQITGQKIIEKRLNENLEFKARLMSLIAHDLSGILQTQAYLSSNLEKDVGPELKNQASILMDSAFASKDFMANILSWVRSQENQFKPIIRSFEMNILIKEVVNDLESVWRVRDLQVELQSEVNPLLMSGDSVMIESIMRNLLSNAIQASAPGQIIQIYLKLNGLDEVKVQVKDQGSGMSPKQVDAIRWNAEEPFSDPERRPRGFGLGLAIARRFSALHNGRLDFESTKGRGTLVTLTLPLQKPGG